MPSVAKATITLCACLVAGMSLSSCHNKKESELLVIKERSDSERVEDKFGYGFGKAFRADQKAEPTNVADTDVQPESLTTEPEPVN